ncbi:DUF3800 domain-containing protein [Lentzea tibetensis]|uniref:DUF3800 domain-containing protein n=1 Tax=Lentzea tibetensis TaxID=2591470 RepID=A0A563ETJ4_9PSEU|nr:DUF3800 domain-containing protein [Lentzea tibetensis]TWP50912.1 DUF3800 domain-containing protein [Lentzea tibetensis]
MVEIACDESGSEGTKLVGGVTDVFAHAGVGLSVAAAAECVQEIRDWIRSPAVEYKANHLLRSKNRAVLEWFLGPTSPVFGHAHVHLVDKALFLASRGVSDPLYPAILRAVELWPGQVSIVHDQYRSLTDDRISQLKSLSPRLADLTLVDSRSDARVQLADFLAGVARRIASDFLNGRGDEELIALLKPYVDRSSVWDPIGFAQLIHPIGAPR